MSEFRSDDYRYMTHALRLAESGLGTVRPNPAVGCVIVASDGQIVGEGWHKRAGEAHAEVNALAQAGDHARGATAYVTLEPCSHQGLTPPCADAIIAAGLHRVIYAVADPNPQVAGAGAQKLKDAGIDVQAGLLSNLATELNRGFFTRMQTGKPWVRSKLAISIDGRTALGNGDSQWITGAEARADVHRSRGRSGAVLTGIETVLKDDPGLNARPDSATDILQPLRVVVDSALRCAPTAQLFSIPGPVTVLHSHGSSAAAAALQAVGATVVKVAAENGRVSLADTLALLAEQSINDVWVEAGPTLNGALLYAGMIDELIVYQASNILGTDGQGMFAIQPLEAMQNRFEFNLIDVRRVGVDVRMTYRPQ
jgi:diaminohydroxyphosphoribosylaminopyrimidine deaminase/5-amino-6-(5-phosphoribosylamino)uracil reductase